MEYLIKLYGIGPQLAQNLLDQFKSKGIKPPESEEEAREILLNSEIFKKLPISTKIDLRERPVKKIPRYVLEVLDREMHKYLKNIKFDIAGSYRRKRPVSHDVDIVVSRGNSKGTSRFDKIVKSMTKSSKVKIKNPFARGNDKVVALINIYAHSRWWKIKVDFFFTDPSSYIFSLLFATGSGPFNIRMRKQAQRKGYLLNEKGLYEKENDHILRRVPVKNEKEIFKLLEVTYRPPELRFR